jgi:hypothetical protein
MRTIRTKIYSFNELSKAAQETALDKLRYINTYDDNWHDFMSEDFQEQLKEVGFDDAKIQFSGFSSQGDGLCFDAKIDALKFAETTNEKRAARLINNNYISEFTIEKTSFANQYSHEKTRYVDYDSTDYNNINEVLENLCDKIEKKRLELCEDFYKRLEKSYYYLQSDEVVKETILANDYEFLSNGTQY